MGRSAVIKMVVSWVMFCNLLEFFLLLEKLSAFIFERSEHYIVKREAECQ